MRGNAGKREHLPGEMNPEVQIEKQIIPPGAVAFWVTVYGRRVGQPFTDSRRAKLYADWLADALADIIEAIAITEAA